MKFRLLVLFIMLFMLSGVTVYADDVEFFYSDVAGVHQEYDIISLYFKNGLLDNETEFRPDDVITQEEFDELVARFYISAEVKRSEGMTRAEALKKLHSMRLIEREGSPVQCILRVEGDYIVDYSTGKGGTTIISVVNGAGVSVVPKQEGFRWAVPDAEASTIYGITIDGEGNSDSKVYNLVRTGQAVQQAPVWAGSFEQIYFLNNEVYVPVSQSKVAGEYMRFIQNGEIGRQEVFTVSGGLTDSYEAQEAVQIRQIEKQRVLTLPSKFELGGDGYAYIQFQDNPKDLETLYVHYNDKRMKASSFPIKTNLAGEYIIEFEGKYYPTAVVKDAPLAEFRTYRPVKLVKSVEEANPANKNILIVDDTAGIDVAAAISKNIYVIATQDSANIIGVVDGEIGTQYSGVDKEYTTVFAVGEEVGYERPESEFEKWTYRTVGRNEQSTLTPLTRFDSIAKYFIEYVTYDGVNLSTNYKSSVIQKSREMGVGQQFTNLTNPTIEMDEPVTQAVPEWFKVIPVDSVENVFNITKRYSKLNLEASEVLIVDKDGNIDNSVGVINKDMQFTCYRRGTYETYLLYRQGRVIHRALLKVDYNQMDVIAINDIINVKWAETVQIPVADIIANDTGIEDDAKISIVLEPVYGSATIEGKNVLYKPEKGFSGSDIFYYRLEDSNIAQVVIDVEAANIPPVVPNSNFTVPINVGTMRLDVLANAVSLDGRVLQITEASTAKGKVSVVAGNFSDMLELSFEQKGVKVGDTFKINFTVAGVTKATATVKVGNKDSGSITVKERPTAYIIETDDGITCQTTGNVVEWKWRVGKDEQVFFTEHEGVSWVNSVGVRGRVVQLRVVDADGLESIPDVLGSVAFSLNKDSYFVGDTFQIASKSAGAVYRVSTKTGQHIVTSSDEGEIFKEVCAFIEGSAIREFMIESDGYTVDFRVYLKTDKPQVQFRF